MFTTSVPQVRPCRHVDVPQDLCFANSLGMLPVAGDGRGAHALAPSGRSCREEHAMAATELTLELPGGCPDCKSCGLETEVV